METDRSQKSDTEGSVASDLSWLLSLNQKSLTDGGSITGSITLDALYNPESYDANAAPRPKSKQHKAPRHKTAAESMGLIRGAKNYRLNSPYLPQPRPPTMLADEEEQLLLAAQAASPEGKGGKKGKPVSKSKTPASPITKMYQALSRRVQQREVCAHDPELQQQLLAKAAKIIHTAAGKETHKRMMLLVHAHTDKKPFGIPKIDAAAEFGGSARSTDEKYSEYYKYKLGINDRQKDEEPLYHEEHVLHFRDKPVELQVSDDSPSINRDPLYRIMREQAELPNLLQGKASKIKSVDSTPAPAFIEANAKYVMTTAIITKLSKMQKPSTEVWCTVRAVYLLMLAFYEHTVRNHPVHCLSMLDMKDGKGTDMQSYSASGSASVISSQAASGAVAGVAKERRAGGWRSSPGSLTSAAGDGAAGNATGSAVLSSAASAAATAAEPLTEDYSATRSRKFWKSLAAKAKEMGTTVHNVSRTFSWDLFRDLLQYPSEFMHSLGDVEAGELSVPTVYPIVRVAGSGSRQVAWHTGSFYRSAERDDRLLGALRVVVGTGVFHPTSTFKTAPCVSVLCSWARSVIAGIFSGRMIINRTISKFPRMSFQGGYDPNKSLDSSLDGSLDGTLLASALMNISQTLPDTALPDASGGGLSTTRAAAVASGVDLNNVGSLAPSPQKRVGHFIETATLQSSVLHEDLPDAIMSVTQAQNAHGAYVPHQINSELDIGTPLHVLAYVPAMRFPANEAALLDTHLPECSVFDVAILLGRPCDRVDVLLGDALQRDSVNEEVAMRYFQKKVMLKSRSPLHRVLVPPYAPTDSEDLNGKQPGVVSFAQIRRAKKGGHGQGHGSGSDVKSSNDPSLTPPAAHSLKDLLAGADGAAEDGALLESTEDALFEFVRRCFNAYPSAETVPANVLTSKLEKPGPTLVLVKGLNHVFQCPKYQTSYDDKKFSRTIMLVPPETQSSASISPYACVSRFVCMIAHGERSRTAFQAALRLSKPGDLLFLVHVLRRTKTGPYDEASSQDLARQYQKLGFNLEIVAEDEVAPNGTADNLQLGKALVNAAAAHAPTHMVLGADHDDADFALFQNSRGGAGGSASVVEGVIRQEKFLCSTYHDSENARRPVLVLGAGV